MPTVTPLGRARLPEATAALARAFHDDPAFESLWPDPAGRRRLLGRFLRLPVVDALRHGSVDAVLVDGAVAGVAAWYPAGAYPRDVRRSLAALPSMLAIAAAAPGAFRRLAGFGARIDAAFPADRPAYLTVIGIAPDAQGGGLGGALLESGLARCDGAGADCYLETDTAGAARLYERHGFETVEAEARLLPGGPPHRRMRRPVGAGGDRAAAPAPRPG